MNFIPEVKNIPQGMEPGFWFAFAGDRLLIDVRENSPKIPYIAELSSYNLKPIRTQYLGKIQGEPCYSAELPVDTILPNGMGLEGLRQLYEKIDNDFFATAGYAIQIVNWDKTHQYCGQCGTPTELKENERAKICPNCGLINFPRLSPAVIVAITKGDKILLARGNRFTTIMYSVLAGFVEPGETLEECVMREVREEVGINVKNITYFGSQPWPFPNSLMVAFTAEYESGEITVDGTEILDAGWFTVDNLPPIPSKISISRWLIDWYIEKHMDSK